MREADSDQRLVDEIRSAYEGSVEGWATGPAAVYRRLAAALIGFAPRSLAGHRVLDLGAGTGVASEALTAAGAQPVGVDLALAMLRHEQSRRPPGVVADAQALPFREGAFDAVVAAFSLNHMPDPVVTLDECRRVTHAGGPILASTFPNDADHPAKAVVEATLEQFGYRRPSWYQTLKDRLAVRTGDVEAFGQAATAAGFADARVDRLEVDAGLHRPELAVEWRLNMPHTIGFVSRLDPQTRAALRASAIAALSGELPSTVPMLVLRAHVA